MLTVNKLEKIIELEDNLRAEYQGKLDAQSAEIERLTGEKQDQLATINRQLETITELSEKAATNQKTEQQNRELHNRSENMREEVASLKTRIKALQKDLVKEREELKTLKQFDPVKMKKNLDANKKKLAEKNTANDLLQKSLNKTRGEKSELEQKVKELESELEKLQPEDLDTSEADQEEAA